MMKVPSLVPAVAVLRCHAGAQDVDGRASTLRMISRRQVHAHGQMPGVAMGGLRQRW